MNQDEPGRAKRVSRRTFLQRTMAGGAAIAGTVPVANADAKPMVPRSNQTEDAAQDPLEDIVARHGSELGDLRKVR